MTEQKLRIGIIGLGIGEAHLKAYQQLSYCSINMLCDLNSERLNEIEDKYQTGATLTEHAETLLTNPEIDVVSIASHDNDHYQQVLLGIKNKKHIFVEKPLCLLEEEAFEIQRGLKKEPGLAFSSNHILRTSPRFQELKENIRQGKLGKIFAIEGDYNYGRIQKILSGWRGEIDNYSPVFGGGIHIADLCRWLLEAEVDEVVAYSNKRITSGTSYRYSDYVSALLSFQNGIVGKISVNLPCVYPHFHRLSVYGSQGSFENHFDEGRYFFQYDSGNSPLSPVEESAERISANMHSSTTPYPGLDKGFLVRDFAESILQKRKPLITKDEVFRSMALCFAIQKASLDPGAHVKVKEIE